MFFFGSIRISFCSVLVFFFCPLGLNSWFLGGSQEDDREELRELEKVTHSSLLEMLVLSVGCLLPCAEYFWLLDDNCE